MPSANADCPSSNSNRTPSPSTAFPGLGDELDVVAGADVLVAVRTGLGAGGGGAAVAITGAFGGRCAFVAAGPVDRSVFTGVVCVRGVVLAIAAGFLGAVVGLVTGDMGAVIEGDAIDGRVGFAIGRGAGRKVLAENL
jgi:hypothetical protein